ncbi:unnamed protein product [Darwinula stevensoni]|uniref:Uncharacterized protein n=1 Tax=Darwinula stevensoni TaxID=69355 RepID=A0A7R9A962_9CRUS|nr:unnamed protein product [Darwinula stevensoni]CAG0897134.1 unnamed protein product [Darwinula stevensoni]
MAMGLHAFAEHKNIEVLDVLEEDVLAEQKYFIAFLKERGSNRHVLLDEVSLTLGFQGRLDEKNISEHWEGISQLRSHVKSLTIAFRPNDLTYSKNIYLQGVKIADVDVHLLSVVKRNTRLVTELFLALGEYLRRVFVCLEPTLRDVEFCYPVEGLMPILLAIPSCPVYDNCEDKLTCQAVRASHVVLALLPKYSISAEKPIFVMVDTMERRNLMLKTLTSVPGNWVAFVDENGFLRKTSSIHNSSCVVIVTGDQMVGYHMKFTTFILDLPESKWKNYPRIISSCHENVIVLMEQDDMKTGKYSQVKNCTKTEEILDMMSITWWKDMISSLQRKGEWEVYTSQPSVWLQTKLLTNKANDHQGSLEGLILERTPSVTVIFGPPCSGRSTLLCESIKHVAHKDHSQHRVLLFLLGSIMSQKLTLSRLQDYHNVIDTVHPVSLQVSCPMDIINHDQVKAVQEKYPDSTIHIHVDDYLIAARFAKEEIEHWTAALNELKRGVNEVKNLTLTVAFQPQSKGGRAISMQKLISFFQAQTEAHVITLPGSRFVTAFTNSILLNHISKNETSNPFRLQAKSLPTASRPGALIQGLKPKYIRIKRSCPGHRLGYVCVRDMKPCVDALVCFLFAITQELSAEHAHVLVSNAQLISSLKTVKISQEKADQLEFVHLEQFRGCESSVSITVNVDDEWLLESVSRSQTRLIIVDCLPHHEEVWQTMQDEGCVEVQEASESNDVNISRHDLLSFDDYGKFLLGPTWDEGGTRIGEDALKRGDILNEDTGAIMCLSDETWKVFNRHKNFPLSASSSPLTDWGYMCVGGTFLPREGRGDMENGERLGILLFARDSNQPNHIIPVVPRLHVWMPMEKLPQVYGEAQVIPSFKKVLFQGKVDVYWGYHTVALLWALDRHLTGLPPLSRSK